MSKTQLRLRSGHGRWFGAMVLAAVVAIGLRAGGAEVVYSTGFEPADGFELSTSLEGYDGWVGSGELGYAEENGIISDGVAGLGQHAYLGGSLVATEASFYSVWRPFEVPSGTEELRFSVLMWIANSSNSQWDNFFWSVYNAEGALLFSLEFDNYYLGVYSWLEGETNGTYSGVAFTNDVAYELEIGMDLANNRWHALLDGVLLETNLPITTAGSALNITDIDGGWSVFEPGVPGDNYMGFDNYSVAAVLGEQPAPPVISQFAKSGGSFFGQVTGAEPGRSYVLEFTPNFAAWNPVSTNTASPGGTFDFVDGTADAAGQRFYRTRRLR